MREFLRVFAPLVGIAAALISLRLSRVCDHDWGMADAETGWDQKCRKCGAWRSGYGRTW